jgi:hypothetical protein
MRRLVCGLAIAVGVAWPVTASALTSRPAAKPMPVAPSKPRPCHLPAVAPSAGVGVIVGGARAEGGPAPGINTCAAEHVQVLDTAGDLVAAVRSSPRSGFVLVVAPGSYVVTAGGSADPTACAADGAKPVPVASGQVVHVTVICSFP